MNGKSRVADAHAAQPKMLSRTGVPVAPRRSSCRKRWQSQRSRQGPTGRPKQIRSSSWPALHMRDPDNTAVDRSRLVRISAASQLRLCCKARNSWLSPSVLRTHSRSGRRGLIKAAETDATKRAFVTFGNIFGLALYDREQRNVSTAKRRDVTAPSVSAMAPIDEAFDVPQPEPQPTTSQR